jgi:hypothetical protein
MKYRVKNYAALRAALVTAVAAAAALALTGCLFSPPPKVPPQQPVEMTTPANVLKNIAIAYNQRNIDLYKKALSPDFVFYFDPRDVGGTPPGKPNIIIPESWSYTEDWGATYNMFQKAYSIDLKIPTSRIPEPEPEEKTFLVENITISLLVMVDELNGFIANQGYCNFEFEKYKNEQNEDRWRLIHWWDRTSQG